MWKCGKNFRKKKKLPSKFGDFVRFCKTGSLWWNNPFYFMRLKKFCEISPEKSLFKICIITMISIDYNSKTAKSHFCLSHCSQAQSFDRSSYSSSQWWTECTTKIRTRNTGTRVPQMVGRNFQFLSLRIYRLQPTIFLGMVVDFFLL